MDWYTLTALGYWLVLTFVGLPFYFYLENKPTYCFFCEVVVPSAICSFILFFVIALIGATVQAVTLYPN